MEALPDDAGWSQVVAADGAFHHALVRAVGSPRLERLYDSLAGEIRLCVAQLRPSWASPSEIGKEHHEVLAVLDSGDVEAAEARMTQHLERAVRDLTARLERRVRPPGRLRALSGGDGRPGATARRARRR